MLGAAEKWYRRAPAWVQTLLLNLYALEVERHRYGRAHRRVLSGLRVQERWPASRIAAQRDARVQWMVRYAYDRSPYYRALLDAARIDPTGIRSAGDLNRIPILTRQVVHDRGLEILTRGRPTRGWLNGHTSGTTGSPLSVWYDRTMCVVNNAVDSRQKAWGGKALSDWIGLFLGRIVVPLAGRRPPFWRANAVQREVWFSSFHMSDENLAAYVAEIRRRRLRFLEGYPSTLYILASYLRRAGDTLPMTAVFTSSETLHDIQRDTIESSFACRLFDFYGMAERVAYAGECEAHAGKHLAEEFGYLEICGPEGQPVPDGEEGWIVGTSLWNTAMPMIRYRTSDRSAFVREPCSCGRELRRIRAVTTKAEDIVVTPDGRMVSPSVLTHPFKPLDSVVKSQIVQERLDRFVVKLVPSAALTESEQQQLLTALRERLGPEASIEIQIVDDIPPEASGKYRWVISKVPHENRVSWGPAA